MEESVKRRDRLKAMRVEAAQTDGSNNVEASSGPVCLSNPLIETSASLPAQDCSATPRFDYYTDPLSAFSGNKKRSFVESQDYHAPPPSNVGSSTMQFSPSHQGSWNPAMAPPVHQFHSNSMHNQRMYPPQAPPYQSGPRGFPNQPNYFQPNPPYPNPVGRPRFSPGQVRSNWSSQSPGPNPERGAYPSHGPGRGMGQSGGRGRGQGSPARGGPPGPERLYHKSMVEDPWKFCQPVRWRSLGTQASCSRTSESPQSWLPKSISSNTTRVLEASSKSRSGLSLAASLAASLYETVHETDDEHGL